MSHHPRLRLRSSQASKERDSAKRHIFRLSSIETAYRHSGLGAFSTGCRRTLAGAFEGMEWSASVVDSIRAAEARIGPRLVGNPDRSWQTTASFLQSSE